MIRSFANVYDNTLFWESLFLFFFDRRTDSKSEAVFSLRVRYNTYEERITEQKVR